MFADRWEETKGAPPGLNSAWVERFVDRPGFGAVPLSHRAAAGAYRLHHLEHRDRGDRLLIATAIELGCPLVTYDSRIRGFGAAHGSQ